MFDENDDMNTGAATDETTSTDGMGDMEEKKDEAEAGSETTEA